MGKLHVASEPTTPGPRLDAPLADGTGPLAAGPVQGLPATRLGAELATLLTRTNGFVAYDGALVVRGCGDAPGDLPAWNAPHGWRAAYGDLLAGLFLFAQDVFGGQFALAGDVVVEVDPETGEHEHVADSLEGWAAWVLDDVDVRTGWPLAREWAGAYGPLGPTERLVPVLPFVLGGAYDVENLRARADAAAMRARGGLARQIVGLPDGTQVRVTE